MVAYPDYYVSSAEIIAILAPLTEDPNAPDPVGWTPINIAAYDGNAEIVRILAPLTDNPNAPGPDGLTPIIRAALDGNAEIFRILAPLIDNLWIQMVGLVRHMSESQKSRILALLTDDPNAPD